MDMLAQIKSLAGDWLQMRAIRTHGSRVGWKIAGRYTDYWKKAQRDCPRAMPVNPVIRTAVERFRADRVMSYHLPEAAGIARRIARKLDEREAAGERLWIDRVDLNSNANYAGDLWLDFPEVKEILQGPLGPFLEGYFGSAYKIFFATMYLSVHEPAGPKTSSLWHSDSGPGTCVNVMFHIDDTVIEDGTTEVLPWGSALEIFARERPEIRRRAAREGRELTGDFRRELQYRWYDEVISQLYADRIVQATGPAGLISAFANNTIHRGGYPQPGHRRRVIIFHAYPSDRPTNWALYDERGIKKSGSYPADPAAEF
ncbi:MAG: hypothetical protein JNL71_16195 [Rhodospirillales bacterium]|nr:hypothetical protein [Rhodospirillales bacterium]